MPKKPFSPQWAERLLRNRLTGVTGSVGVAVTDLATGRSAYVNADQPYEAASVAKIPIAMTVLSLVSQGRLSLDDLVTYQSATDYEGGAGSLQFTIQEGEQIPIRYLLDRMIRVSDNIARNMLERYVGSDTVRQYMLSLGVEPPYEAETPMVNARGTNRLLALLDAGRAGITPELTSYLIGLLASTIYNQRLPAKLPAGATVAHKVGTLANVVHDAGIVYAPDRSFIISVFTQDIPERTADGLIADLAAIIYWYEDWLVTDP